MLSNPTPNPDPDPNPVPNPIPSPNPNPNPSPNPNPNPNPHQVDMPGLGFARVPAKQRAQWREFLGRYMGLYP